MSSTPTKVLCVDDNRDLAEMLCALVDSEPDLRCVGIRERADELADSLAELSPDIVLLDLTMPGRSPLDVMTDAIRAHPRTRFIIVSGYDDQESIDRAIDHGAWGYASKHADFPKLIDTIRRVARGEMVLRP